LSARWPTSDFVRATRIGILALNSDRYLEYFFAMARGGFVFVPINTRLAPPEVLFWLTDSDCGALFVDDTFLPMLTQLRRQLPALRHVIHLGDGAAPESLIAYKDLISGKKCIDDAGHRDDDLAGIFYTGGTTGRSKGVMLSHRNIVGNAILCAPEFRFSRYYGANATRKNPGPLLNRRDERPFQQVCACRPQSPARLDRGTDYRLGSPPSPAARSDGPYRRHAQAL
jgi:acyl-CoA synthetase (AMP-forming)/AMP-acid ligase II